MVKQFPPPQKKDILKDCTDRFPRKVGNRLLTYAI